MSGKLDEIRSRDFNFSEDNKQLFYLKSSFLVFDLVIYQWPKSQDKNIWRTKRWNKKAFFIIFEGISLKPKTIFFGRCEFDFKTFASGKGIFFLVSNKMEHFYRLYKLHGSIKKIF